MFENFKYDNELKDAHLSKLLQTPEIMTQLLDWTKNGKNILYFCGNVGNGKSYFASAYKNYLDELKRPYRCFTEAHFINEMKMCIDQPAWPPEYRLKRICESYYFIYDDLGSVFSSDKGKSDWIKSLLSQMLDFRYSSGMPTLITSNYCKKEIDQIFPDRFSDRLYAKKNTIVEIHEESRRK